MTVDIESTAAPLRIEDLQRKTKVTGKVTRIELYGAFIDIGVGTDAVIHISQLGQKVNRVSDVINVGDEFSTANFKLESGSSLSENA